MSAANATHAFEQFAAASRDSAEPVISYFKALVGGGFTREEALELTVEWQNAMTHRLFYPPKEGI